jgi:DNA-binding XRE family transcriptional regulator
MSLSRYPGATLALSLSDVLNENVRDIFENPQKLVK